MEVNQKRFATRLPWILHTNHDMMLEPKANGNDDLCDRYRSEFPFNPREPLLYHFWNKYLQRFVVVVLKDVLVKVVKLRLEQVGATYAPVYLPTKLSLL